MDDIPLRDIKSVVEIDSNLSLFLVVVLIVVLVVVGLLFFGLKFKKKRYNFDLNNPKETAYKLIYLIRDKSGSKEYIDKLHNYTYKKDVPPLDVELVEEIRKKFKI